MTDALVWLVSNIGLGFVNLVRALATLPPEPATPDPVPAALPGRDAEASAAVPFFGRAAARGPPLSA